MTIFVGWQKQTNCGLINTYGQFVYSKPEVWQQKLAKQGKLNSMGKM